MQGINLVFPHQLFKDCTILDKSCTYYLIEEYLYFNQYKFHQQKIAFHRATMRYYMEYLQSQGCTVEYVSAQQEESEIKALISTLITNGITDIHYIDPVDDWLSRRIISSGSEINLHQYESPQFLNTEDELSKFFRADKKSYFQTTWYKQQRKRLNILLDDDDKPLGGKWTYDTDNRKKYPKKKLPPAIHWPASTQHWEEAIHYTKTHYADNPGTLSKSPLYPTTHPAAADWYRQFLEYRFYDFGAYEDAIVDNQPYLHHSLLSPLINVGLLLPGDVVSKSLTFAESEQIPINSTEGFIRQIIGWREFIRGMYVCKGSHSRTQNFWKFDRKIPPSFYDGTTGILPVDNTIKQVIATGYCHHIERLMILGNFMLLCEFDPDEVYRWFMELFIDAYDWVMVPNVYGMSQFADGGTFATKPYLSGSNYIRKMSNYGKGDWQGVWDGLFWRFIDKHQTFFKSNHRMSMLYYSYQKMSEEKKEGHLTAAEKFLNSIDEQL